MLEQNQPVREGESQLAKNDPPLPSPDFIKIEKSLAEIGFFSPSAKRIRNVKEKIVPAKATINGKKVPVLVHIFPSAKYGLPTTADQDKYFAFQKIVIDIKQQDGQVKMPVAFDSAELLGILGKCKDSGKNYDDVDEWLDRMQYTGISHLFLIGKGWVKERDPNKTQNKIFDRSISAGALLDDGTTTDKHLVWLSEWQLKNILDNHLLPIEFETYKKLKRPIAKALVPLLQIWLYASREDGTFEILYKNFCQILCIEQYKHYSDIVRKLSPALNELKTYSYISDWKIEEAAEGSYKLILWHGDKFKEDQEKRLAQKQKKEKPKLKAGESDQPAATDEPTTEIEAILSEMAKREIDESRARKFLLSATPERRATIRRQLEYLDFQTSHKTKSDIPNKGGYYFQCLKNDISVPESFEDSNQHTDRLAKEKLQKLAEEQRAALMQAAYEKQYEQAKEMLSQMPEEQKSMLKEQATKSLKDRFKSSWANLKPETKESAVKKEMLAILCYRIPLEVSNGMMSYTGQAAEQGTGERPEAPIRSDQLVTSPAQVLEDAIKPATEGQALEQDPQAQTPAPTLTSSLATDPDSRDQAMTDHTAASLTKTEPTSTIDPNLINFTNP